MFEVELDNGDIIEFDQEPDENQIRRAIKATQANAPEQSVYGKAWDRTKSFAKSTADALSPAADIASKGIEHSFTPTAPSMKSFTEPFVNPATMGVMQLEGAKDAVKDSVRGVIRDTVASPNVASQYPTTKAAVGTAAEMAVDLAPFSPLEQAGWIAGKFMAGNPTDKANKLRGAAIQKADRYYDPPAQVHNPRLERGAPTLGESALSVDELTEPNKIKQYHQSKQLMADTEKRIQEHLTNKTRESVTPTPPTYGPQREPLPLPYMPEATPSQGANFPKGNDPRIPPQTISRVGPEEWANNRNLTGQNAFDEGGARFERPYRGSELPVAPMSEAEVLGITTAGKPFTPGQGRGIVQPNTEREIAEQAEALRRSRSQSARQEAFVRRDIPSEPNPNKKGVFVDLEGAKQRVIERVLNPARQAGRDTSQIEGWMNRFFANKPRFLPEQPSNMFRRVLDDEIGNKWTSENPSDEVLAMQQVAQFIRENLSAQDPELAAMLTKQSTLFDTMRSLKKFAGKGFEGRTRTDTMVDLVKSPYRSYEKSFGQARKQFDKAKSLVGKDSTDAGMGLTGTAVAFSDDILKEADKRGGRKRR